MKKLLLSLLIALSGCGGGQTYDYSITDPGPRITFPGLAGNYGSMEYQYLGEVDNPIPLASGGVRHQFALILEGINTCNLIYAVRVIDPDPRYVVVTKINPGKTKHSECGVQGYTLIQPEFIAPAPSLNPGDTGTFSAYLAPSGDMEVKVDGKIVWKGKMSAEGMQLKGLPGYRTDNIKIDFNYSGNP